ncbi:MAG: hypothetical protein Q4G49_14020 [Paracoccus sp. (in: a-proteobacteria)]|nr:hypothetical protein [Paracoccus sp. (in: a-proteobacteria)]
MILIAGGRTDPNMRRLAGRLQERGIVFHDLLTGAGHCPQMRIDLGDGRLFVDDKPLSVSACFMRQDVFLLDEPDPAAAQVAAMNWFQALRGWSVSQPGIRLFNRHTYLRENNKIQNLILARDSGLAVPPTIITNGCPAVPDDVPHIQKPVAGGEYTAELGATGARYPRFVQPRLNRPEMRVYRIGSQIMGFWLNSADLDYRRADDVSLTRAEVPSAIAAGLIRLCDRLELDFAAADFMSDDQGRLTFLEVNTQPMFAAFDRVADGALCDAIIDGLAAPAAQVTTAA